MKESTLITSSPNELVTSIVDSLESKIEQLTITINSKTNESFNKPHLTRKECAKFFDVTVNCINDWSKKGILKPYKVGQRVYFKYSDVLGVMFNQKTA